MQQERGGGENEEEEEAEAAWQWRRRRHHSWPALGSEREDCAVQVVWGGVGVGVGQRKSRVMIEQRPLRFCKFAPGCFPFYSMPTLPCHHPPTHPHGQGGGHAMFGARRAAEDVPQAAATIWSPPRGASNKPPRPTPIFFHPNTPPPATPPPQGSLHAPWLHTPGCRHHRQHAPHLLPPTHLPPHPTTP